MISNQQNGSLSIHSWFSTSLSLLFISSVFLSSELAIAHSETAAGDCHVHMNSGEQHCAADVRLPTPESAPKPTQPTNAGETPASEADLPVLELDSAETDDEAGGSVVDQFQQLEAKSSMIAGIQGGLARLGYRPGPATGSINPLTQAAISAFQRDNFLPLSGQPSLSLLTIIEDELKARTQQRHE